MGVAAIAAVASIAGTGLQAYGAYEEFKANESEAKYQAQISRNNVKIIEQRKADLRTVGAQQVARLKNETVQFAADQVTGFAATGIDISSAVVSEVIEETTGIGAADIVQAQKNIEREIWGLDIQKMSEQATAIFQESRARRFRKLAPIAAFSSLLGSAGGIAGSSLIGSGGGAGGGGAGAGGGGGGSLLGG